MVSPLMCKVTILPHDAYLFSARLVYNVIAILPPPATIPTLYDYLHQNSHAFRIERHTIYNSFFSLVTFSDPVNIFRLPYVLILKQFLSSADYVVFLQIL